MLEIPECCNWCGDNFIDEEKNIAFVRGECVCDNCADLDWLELADDARNGVVNFFFNVKNVEKVQVQYTIEPRVRTREDGCYAPSIVVRTDFWKSHSRDYDSWYKDPVEALVEARRHAQTELTRIGMAIQQLAKRTSAEVNW